MASGLFYFDTASGDRTTSEPTYVRPFEAQKTATKEGHFQPALCFGTDSEQEEIMQRVFKDIMPLKVNRVRGPGNKFLHLANERSDYFVNLVPNYSLYELCAPEAVFASRFGILTDAKQKPLIYDASRRSFGLFNGVVAARDAGTYLQAKLSYEDKSGSTLALSQTQIRREVHLKKQAQSIRA